MKHHKKRNTAFLYEVLVREGTKAALEKNIPQMKLVKSIILGHFEQQSMLRKELELYKAIIGQVIEKTIAESFVREVMSQHEKLNKELLFEEQTKLINKINKTIGQQVYETFVPNYKELASLSQLFAGKLPIKDKVLLERSIIYKLSAKESAINEKTIVPIDSLVLKTFNKKFNDKYSSLLDEQKELLSKYTTSFEDNDLGFKVYLNEEIGRLKQEINEVLKKDEVRIDQELYEKTQKVQDYLEGLYDMKVAGVDTMQRIMKIQKFLKEVQI